MHYQTLSAKYCKGELWVFLCLRQQREPVLKLQGEHSQSHLQRPTKLCRERGGSLGLCAHVAPVHLEMHMKAPVPPTCLWWLPRACASRPREPGCCHELAPTGHFSSWLHLPHSQTRNNGFSFEHSESFRWQLLQLQLLLLDINKPPCSAVECPGKQFAHFTDKLRY